MDYQHIVILTGAGVSAESGIPVFRSETGLWENHRVEDVCVHSALVRNPQLVHDFYNNMRQGLKTKLPNEAHRAIAKLQQEWPSRGGSVTLVTQNIDDLHEKAGSMEVIHMHGELNSLWCTACGKRFYFDGISSPQMLCPYCGKAAVRPDIVFFEEIPYHMEEILAALLQCDLFIAVGTSGVVYPAAGFCQYARAQDSLCVEFNLERSAVATSFHYGLYGKASVTLPAFVNHLLATGEPLKQLS